MPFSDDVLGRPGFLHGGAIGGLLEMAAIVALHAALESEGGGRIKPINVRSEEHTSELQSLMRISYAVFCLKKKTGTSHNTYKNPQVHNQIQIHNIQDRAQSHNHSNKQSNTQENTYALT